MHKRGDKQGCSSYLTLKRQLSAKGHVRNDQFVSYDAEIIRKKQNHSSDFNRSRICDHSFTSLRALVAERPLNYHFLVTVGLHTPR